MTNEEAKKVLEIISCEAEEYCMNNLFREFVKAFPEFASLAQNLFFCTVDPFTDE